MRCRFGLHRWAPWRYVKVYYTSPRDWFLGQCRTCVRCGIEKTRTL